MDATVTAPAEQRLDDTDEQTTDEPELLEELLVEEISIDGMCGVY